MRKTARRLSAAEIARIEETQGRICRGCRTIYPPADVPTSFGADARTKDGLTSLCLKCLVLRDSAAGTRQRKGHSDIQAEYRDLRKKMLLAASKAHLDEYLAHTPPQHAIPLRAMPGYPDPHPNAPQRTSTEDAILTRLYSKLRDVPFVAWEDVSGISRHKVPDYFKLGIRSLNQIDEHLIALGLDPLKP